MPGGYAYSLRQSLFFPARTVRMHAGGNSPATPCLSALELPDQLTEQVIAEGALGIGRLQISGEAEGRGRPLVPRADQRDTGAQRVGACELPAERLAGLKAAGGNICGRSSSGP